MVARAVLLDQAIPEHRASAPPERHIRLRPGAAYNRGRSPSETCTSARRARQVVRAPTGVGRVAGEDRARCAAKGERSVFWVAFATVDPPRTGVILEIAVRLDANG